MKKDVDQITMLNQLGVKFKGFVNTYNNLWTQIA